MAQFRVPVLEHFSWQEPIKDKDLSSDPASPAKGDRYIVASVGTGLWVGSTNTITWFDGTDWKFDVASEGWRTWVQDEDLFYTFDGTSWAAIGESDMLRSVYDTDTSGIVDKAETVDDGAGSASTAVQVKDAVDKAHTSGSETQVGDVSGTVGANVVDTVGGKTAADIASTVNASHTQNTDTSLDLGGANPVTAAEAKEAFDKRGNFDTTLKLILFNL